MRTRASSPVHRAAVVAAVVAFTLPCASVSRATLIIEPVFNRVAGSGPADNSIPLYDPTYLVDGVAYYLADEPGEIDIYAAGDPPDPDLNLFHIWNNTRYDLTGFTLRLVGTATDTLDPGTIVRGPVDAVWGDADGDGRVGLSDIFSTITVSADGKEIRVEGGLIPVDGRFTDIHLARSDNPPELAGIESSFTGVQAVPEPGSLALSGVGIVILSGYGWARRRAALALASPPPCQRTPRSSRIRSAASYRPTR